jgi:hypothetical protein
VDFHHLATTKKEKEIQCDPCKGFFGEKNVPKITRI